MSTRFAPVLALFGTTLGLVALYASSAEAKTVELKNDTLANNSEGSAICGFAVGEGIGAKFTPPAFPAKLLKVRVLLTNVGFSQTACNHVAVNAKVPLSMEIFNMTTAAPGTSLGAAPDLVVSNDTVLNEFDLSPEKIEINDGSFFISFTFPADNASPMVDKSTPVAGANYIYGDIGQGKAWYGFDKLGASAPKGNWVVRIDVDVPGADDAGADTGAPDATADSSAAGAAGAAGASGGAGAAGAAGGADAGAQPPPEEASGGGGCATGRSNAGWLAGLALGLFALLGARRRR
ncbi:MAG: hypothetical protein HY898_13670 [Deltaproteobacteria bacterium]|nr:hypothetical protein [Deltaproteobacteria bacterium]